MDSPFCYCCGGTKNYVEHGEICRRFCTYEIINGKPIKPCYVNKKYDLEVNKSHYDSREPYPTRVTLVPITEIVCKEG